MTPNNEANIFTADQSIINWSWSVSDQVKLTNRWSFTYLFLICSLYDSQLRSKNLYCWSANNQLQLIGFRSTEVDQQMIIHFLFFNLLSIWLPLTKQKYLLLINQWSTAVNRSLINCSSSAADQLKLINRWSFTYYFVISSLYECEGLQIQYPESTIWLCISILTPLGADQIKCDRQPIRQLCQMIVNKVEYVPSQDLYAFPSQKFPQNHILLDKLD